MHNEKTKIVPKVYSNWIFVAHFQLAKKKSVINKKIKKKIKHVINKKMRDKA